MPLAEFFPGLRQRMLSAAAGPCIAFSQMQPPPPTTTPFHGPVHGARRRCASSGRSGTATSWPLVRGADNKRTTGAKERLCLPNTAVEHCVLTGREPTKPLAPLLCAGGVCVWQNQGILLMVRHCSVLRFARTQPPCWLRGVYVRANG